MSASGSGAEKNTIFSFAAAGWLQMYHFGVAKALQDSGIASPEALQAVDAELGTVRFAGSSAGSLAASALVVGTDFEALREYACGCAVDCRSQLFGAFQIRKYVQRGVELFATGAFKEATKRVRERRRVAIRRKTELRSGSGGTRRRRKACDDASNDDSGYASDENISEADFFDDGEFNGDAEDARGDLSDLLKERLEVYATTLPFLREKRFTEFNTVEDLDEALSASCLLVPLAGLPFRLRETQEWVMDGGVAAFQPRAGERGVITVSGMYFASADIKPSEFIPVWWGLYPPNDAQYRSLFALGYDDCLDGIRKKHLISPETFASLHGKYQGDTVTVPGRGLLALLRDAVAFWFFMFVLRPFGLVLVYAEMIFVLAATAAVAVLHDVLPSSSLLAALAVGTRTARRRDGTRGAAWVDVYAAVRNLISMRVPFHIIVGSRIPVNARRLERYSRVYRALRPFLG